MKPTATLDLETKLPPQEDAFLYKEALNSLVLLQNEHHALNGGGPNWQARWDKALEYAEELVRVEP